MASTLQKLLRKPPLPPFRFITLLNPNPNPNPNPSQQPQNPILTLFHPQQPSSTLQHFDAPTVIFPSFPFGFFPKPVFESGFGSPDDGVVEEDSRTLWADSVKKKRKKKMNKHKYQKLRKRMRRQS
ncbi:hypothetical protein VNO78_33570 [Psophocarpus tetragonolobus]|uniref:Small ribosomal subunit protein mS38 n=1 Tax=Psophocarpus tetragonolobus TaxID=3891 RepID=A0AAN9NXN1_PSOTE